jgi:hypothetical protein
MAGPATASRARTKLRAYHDIDVIGHIRKTFAHVPQGCKKYLRSIVLTDHVVEYDKESER